GAVLAHPAAAAAAPTAARPVVARFVVQTRSDGVRVGLAGLPVVIPTSAAAAATAATAAVAGVLVVGGDGGAVALALVLLAGDQVVLLLLALVVESLVGQIRLGRGQGDIGPGDEVLARLGPLDGVLRMGQGVVQQHGDEQAVTGVQPVEVVPLVVEDVQGHRGRHAQGHGPGPAAGDLDVHGPQGHQGGRFRRPDAPGALAVLAHVGHALEQAQAAALAADLHQAEAGDLAHLDAAPVRGHGVLELLLDRQVGLRLL